MTDTEIEMMIEMVVEEEEDLVQDLILEVETTGQEEIEDLDLIPERERPHPVEVEVTIEEEEEITVLQESKIMRVHPQEDR
jgi:hypothetical protein